MLSLVEDNSQLLRRIRLQLLIADLLEEAQLRGARSRASLSGLRGAWEDIAEKVNLVLPQC